MGLAEDLLTVYQKEIDELKARVGTLEGEKGYLEQKLKILTGVRDKAVAKRDALGGSRKEGMAAADDALRNLGFHLL